MATTMAHATVSASHVQRGALVRGMFSPPMVLTCVPFRRDSESHRGNRSSVPSRSASVDSPGDTPWREA